MVHTEYKIHLTPVKNKYIFQRENFPRIMIYVNILDGKYELTNLNFLDHCDALRLGKVMIEFHHYVKGEIGEYLDDVVGESPH